MGIDWHMSVSHAPDPPSPHLNQPINQSINQSINPSISQPIKKRGPYPHGGVAEEVHSINQPINQSINQSVNQSTNQPTKKRGPYPHGGVAEEVDGLLDGRLQRRVLHAPEEAWVGS